jgi:hypothetical protein
MKFKTWVQSKTYHLNRLMFLSVLTTQEICIWRKNETHSDIWHAETLSREKIGIKMKEKRLISWTILEAICIYVYIYTIIEHRYSRKGPVTFYGLWWWAVSGSKSVAAGVSSFRCEKKPFHFPFPWGYQLVIGRLWLVAGGGRVWPRLPAEVGCDAPGL